MAAAMGWPFEHYGRPPKGKQPKSGKRNGGRALYLVNAYNQGLGQIQQDRIELVGASLAELQMQWRPAEHLEGFGDVILPALILQTLGLW